MDQFEDTTAILLEMCQRRADLSKQVIYCPACRADQVQLIDSRLPANWKCRICKQTFACEPREKIAAGHKPLIAEI